MSRTNFKNLSERAKKENIRIDSFTVIELLRTITNEYHSFHALMSNCLALIIF
jgi:hypothetical protein